MKSALTRLIAALALSSAAYSAQAAIYICQVDGRAVFTQTKQGSNCVESHMQGSQEIAPEVAASAVPVEANLKEKPGSAAPDISDIKILPRPEAAGSVTNTSEAANPKMNVKLRNGSPATAPASSAKSAKARAAELNRKAKIIPAPVIAAPVAKPKPQLTRKQILQNEVRNEKTALVRAQAQLNVARSKGDKAKISRLEQDVRDRQANIRAIEGEMSR